MNVKLMQGAVGQNFNFLPRQVIACPSDIGKRLVEGRLAVKAPDDAEIDGEWPVLSAEEKAEAQAAARVKYKKMGLDPDKVFAKRRGVIEKAIKPKPETPEDDKTADPSDPKCAGKTGQGNPCGRKPAADSKFCAAHEPK